MVATCVTCGQIVAKRYIPLKPMSEHFDATGHDTFRVFESSIKESVDTTLNVTKSGGFYHFSEVKE